MSTPSSANSFNESNIPAKVKIRFSDPQDVDRVMDYYLSNPHPGYAPREDTPEQIRKGRAIIVEDDAGTIWAASVAYDVMGKDPETGEDVHRWSTIGTTRITLNGCGLYPPLIAAQALYEEFTNKPRDHVFAIVQEENKAVIGLLNGKLQWLQFDPPAELDEKCQAMRAADKKDIPVNYYQCSDDQMPHQARTVLKMIDEGGLTHKSGQKIEFDTCDFPFDHEFKAPISELVKRGENLVTFDKDNGNDNNPLNSDLLDYQHNRQK